MKKLLLLLLCLLLPVCALGETMAAYPYTFSGEEVSRYESETLQVTVERFQYEGTTCYVSKIWMADPGRQIKKATANWEEDIQLPETMAKKIPGAALVINGSGYVSPVFPWIPENYPGVSEDYHYTPLGSLTITNGEVFRCLPGVPYYGLTLQADGLHMHVGEDNMAILKDAPTQTWSFYVECPIITDHQSILDPQWRFSYTPAIRTMIAKMDQNNYITVTVTSRGGGLTMTEAVQMLLTHFDPQWAYNLDGGPSSALMARATGEEELVTLWGGRSQDADIMAFTELTE